jgi:hypothetical protein
MDNGVNVPVMIHYRRHDGTETFESYLPQVPKGVTLRQVVSMLAMAIAAAEAKGEDSDLKSQRRDFLWTWYGADAWISDTNVGIPRSAEKHLLVGVQTDLAGQHDRQYWERLAAFAGEKYGFKDRLPGEPGRRVFIIHGRDQKSLTQLSAFLGHLGFTPLSLSRLPTHGSETLIEALERLLPEAEFIVALFTPDDEGRLRNGVEPLKPRVRQNVLIEAGFAVIQRRRESIIVALGETDIPSDLAGIRRIEADEWNSGVEEQLERALAILESEDTDPA